MADMVRTFIPTAALAAALMAGAAAAQDAPPQSPELQRDEAAIYAAIHRVETAWRAGDADDLVANFAPDAELVSFGDRRVIGRAAIRDHYARAFQGLFARTAISHLDDVSLRLITPDAAVATYSGTLSPTTELAEPACSPTSTVMLSRQPSTMSADGEWIIEYFAMTDSPLSDCMAPGR